MALGRKRITPVDALPYALLAERHGLSDEAIRLFEPMSRDPRVGPFARQHIEALRNAATSR